MRVTGLRLAASISLIVRVADGRQTRRCATTNKCKSMRALCPLGDLARLEAAPCDDGDPNVMFGGVASADQNTAVSADQRAAPDHADDDAEQAAETIIEPIGNQHGHAQ